MPLKTSVFHLLQQLQSVLHELSDQQYITPVALFSNATIGGHTRHIIEFFMAVNSGYVNGTVNYDKRKRDHAIESERHTAIRALHEISKELNKPDKELLLETDWDMYNNTPVIIKTNYNREMMYNLEHMVHHMAILRVSILSVSNIVLPENFGVAHSTIKYRKACAQ